MTAKELDKLEADFFTICPPCQPFTRQGKRDDCRDHRTDSFFHLMSLLPQMTHKVKFIFVENVKGFEESETRKCLIQTLHACEMDYREFLVSPTQFGIPNSRLRYYLLAKLKSEPEFAFPPSQSGKPFTSFPPVHQQAENVVTSHKTVLRDVENVKQLSAFCPKHILEGPEFDTYAVPSRLVAKYVTAMDIVKAKDTHTCCFTKAYGHYVVGTGSVLQQNGNVSLDSVYKQYCHLLSQNKLQSKVRVESNPDQARSNPDQDRSNLDQDRSNLDQDRSNPDQDRSNPDQDRSNLDLNRGKYVFDEDDDDDPNTGKPLPEEFSIEVKEEEKLQHVPHNVAQYVSNIAQTSNSTLKVCNTGSKLSSEDFSIHEDEITKTLSPLRLRYFTEYEIAALLCFPPTFTFPASTSLKQRYKALGNSLNVHVVATLMQCLFDGVSL